MSLAIRMQCEPLRSLANGAILAGYMGIGTTFDHPIRLIFIQNLTNALLMFSFDGINDHFPLDSSAFLLLDVTTNKTSGSGWFIAEGSRMYAKQIEVPTTGSVYVTAFYGADV
jgi:hypothetical protein